MKSRYALTLAVALVFIAAAACGSDKTTATSQDRAVDSLRASLAPFASLTMAKNAGYSTALTDCMSNGDVGAMGVHFAKTALIDASLDALHPEVLVYEPGTNGEMSLVGVEFIIPFDVLLNTSPAPMLFGEKFLADDAFGLWGLHVWTHRFNPSGRFAPWNPRVHC